MADIATALPTRTLIPDNTTFQSSSIAGSDHMFQVGGLYDTTPPAISDGNVGVARINSARQWMSQIFGDNGGTSTAISVNGSGQLVVSLAAGSSSVFAEDSVHVSGDNGNFILAVRNDAGTALAADGDYIPLTTDSTGRLRVDAEFTSAFDFAEDAAHTTGDRGAFVLAVRNDVLTNVLTSANLDYSPFAVSGEGHIFSKLVGNNGGTPTLISVDSSGNVQVDIVSTSGQFAEDSAHTTGDLGTFALAVRNDTNGSLTSADLDYSPISVDSSGRLKVVLSGTGSGQFAEDSAHTTGDLGNFALAVRNDANAVLTSADLDYSPIAVDSAGRLKVIASVAINAEKAEDSGHVSGDTGSFMLSVQSSSIASLVSANLDYAPVQVDTLGCVKTAWMPSPDGASITYATGTIAGNATSSAFASVTATGGTLYVHSVFACSTAPGKIECMNNAVTVGVAIWPAAGNTVQIWFDKPVVVASGDAFDIDVTNRTGSSADFYVTINATQA